MPDAVVLSCAGGEREADRAKGRAILAGLVARPDATVDVTHDAIAALYAGNPAGCGVVLITGTGSIAYGRNDQGARGALRWLGLPRRRRGLGGLVRPRGPSRRLVRPRRPRIADPDHAAPVRGSRSHGLQRRAPLALRAAAPRTGDRRGDARARGRVRRRRRDREHIVQRGANALARAATVVALTLGLPGGPVYLAGGAFETSGRSRRPCASSSSASSPQAAVEPVREEPAMGAARLAAALAWGAA